MPKRLTSTGALRASLAFIATGLDAIERGKQADDVEVMVGGTVLVGVGAVGLSRQRLTPSQRRLARMLARQCDEVKDLRRAKSRATATKWMEWRSGGRAEARAKAWKVRSTARRVIVALGGRIVADHALGAQSSVKDEWQSGNRRA